MREWSQPPAWPCSVSIRAPRCRGAMLFTPSYADDVPSSFNPRPSLPRGDARCSFYTSETVDSFQSAPLVAEGRCSNNTSSSKPGSSCFNPRPSLPRGDARDRRPHATFPESVSIRAPRCRGAMLIFPNLWKQRNKLSALREPLAHERKASYAKWRQAGKLNEFSAEQAARTSREIHGHSRFAQDYKTRGASKSVARKRPYSLTS